MPAWFHKSKNMATPPAHDDDLRPARPESPFWSEDIPPAHEVELDPASVDVADDGLVAAQVFPDHAIAPPALRRPRPQTVLVDRAFGFADLCGFSRFTADRGPAAAFEELTAFRDVVRTTAASRGVRIARWIGDGVFLVGVGPGPVVAALAEVALRHGQHTLVRAAVAAGPALLFEGDDYLGDPPNRASRLCNMAEPGQLLVSPEVVPHLPEWLEAIPVGPVELRGIGTLDGVCNARPIAEIRSQII